ncbi:MAG TPA: aminotransferase class IV [Planctomycetota bacterium]
MSVSRDPTQFALVDGRFVAPGSPALPADLPGVLRGEGIFESFRIEAGVPSPFLADHAARLERSAGIVGMELGERGLLADLPELLAALRALPGAERGPAASWRARYTLLRRSDGGLLRMWTVGLPAPPPREVVLQLSRFRRDPEDPLWGAKTVSRMQSQVARAEAERAGAWEALLPTIEGDLAECTSANVFVVHQGVLKTPPAGRGLLLGVTRAAVLRAARAAGIPAAEQEIPQSCLQEAVEVYITNAVIGLVPTSRILGARELLPGVSGRFLPALREAYQAELARAEARRAPLSTQA